jgi:hypothetical protein
MNCIGNHPSLFLQRLYSENSPQNCSETTLSPVHPPHRFCRKSSPLATSLPPSNRSEIAIGRNMQCERGNFKVISAVALNNPFALTSRTSGRSRRRASSFWRQRADADGLGGNVHAADRHPIATDAAAHERFGDEQEEHDDGKDK